MIKTYDNLEKLRLAKYEVGKKAILARQKYRQLDAFKKRMKSKLFLKAEGSNIKEKEANVEIDRRWLVYSRGLIAAQEMAEKWEHKHDDLKDQWLTLYAELKHQEQERLNCYAGK